MRSGSRLGSIEPLGCSELAWWEIGGAQEINIMCDDSRARRTAMRLLAPWLVAGMGVTGSGTLAAMPYLGAGAQASRLILVQATPGQEPAGTPSGEQSPPDSFVELHEALAAARERLDELSRAAEAVAAGGELQRELAAAQAENRALRAELEALRAERDQLARASKEAEARAIEAEQGAEQTTAAARRIDQELVAVRWQNAQLNTSLQQAAARRAQIEAEARETQAALQSRMKQLEAAAATATSEVIRLRGELNAAEERIAAAAGAEAEKAQAAQRIRALETERDGLLGDLAELRARLEALQAAKAQLEAQVDQLHEAAANATDLARQNLLALEDRLRQLKGSLETIEPAGGAPEPAPAPVERSD